MSIHVRQGESLPPDATVLIHMGSGAVEHIVSAAMRNYRYSLIRDNGYGYFTVSVFAPITWSEEEIVMMMRHGSFARTTVGDVLKAGFDLLPTSDFDDVEDVQDRLLQEAHYDIILRLDDDPSHLVDEPIGGNAEVTASCMS